MQKSIMKKLIFKSRLKHTIDRLPNKTDQLNYAGVDPNILMKKPIVAVVGTRKPTPYGRQVTEQIVTDLVRAGVVVVSGLAFGVDIISAKTALQEGGESIAVLPSGINNIYPASHQNIAKSLEENGCLISEYPSDHKPRKVEFLERNRIIAALSDIVVIPEAAARSGSLNTAFHALSMGITVCAVPGPITSSMSAGTNHIIKDGKATLITSAQDVLELLGIKIDDKEKLIGGNDQETAILQTISSGINDSTLLQHELKIETTEFQTHMTMLEINGKVRQNETGNWYLS